MAEDLEPACPHGAEKADRIRISGLEPVKQPHGNGEKGYDDDQHYLGCHLIPQPQNQKRGDSYRGDRLRDHQKRVESFIEPGERRPSEEPSQNPRSRPEKVPERPPGESCGHGA